MSAEAIQSSWDRRYAEGQYEVEAPIAFVQTIIDELGEVGESGLGLYVGCGNGRNYKPLHQHGLRIYGVDSSAVGIAQLVESYPDAAGLVRPAIFADITAAAVFDYLVSIQVFQHGNIAEVNNNFRQARDILAPGGKMFLRVNSISTDVIHPHSIEEYDELGGYTLRYESEPKAGEVRHFFSKEELEVIAKKYGFNITSPLNEVHEPRHEPDSGYWSQWESIWQKNA